MKRDGALESLWQYKVSDYQPAGYTDTANDEFDVLIAGGGMTGIVTGYLLQKAGKKCVIVEAQTLGFGTTGGTTAHLNTFFDTTYDRVEKDFSKDDAALLAAAAKESLALIKQVAGENNIDCDLAEKTGYIFSLNEEQDKALEKLIDAANSVNVAMDIINDSPFPIPYTKIAAVPAQAQFHPTKYILGLAKAFEVAGGTILTGCRVTGTAEATVITVKTTKGEIKAKTLIWATHIPPGVNLLHFRAAPYRSYVIGVTLHDNNYPDALGYDMQDPYHYYRTHEVDGKKYLIVGGEDHKTAHEENTDTCFRNLESYVRKYYDVKEVAFKWSSQYYEPADGLPYIGNLPGNGGNIFVGTGYGGNGMMYSHIAAMTFSDILVKGDSKYRQLFDPNRVKPVAGFTQFVKENADVVKNFISGKLSSEKIRSFGELAAGEAKVVKYEGEKIAMYKDEQHTVHAVNPTCTHVHCTVSWNSAEKSWDCPCHGARYTCTGEVLNGPAVKDLERIDLND